MFGANCQFQSPQGGQTARINAIVLDVGLTSHAHITMTQDRLDHNVSHAQFMHSSRCSHSTVLNSLSGIANLASK